ncbi:MAG: hypothetical protein AAGL10_05650 [Pseudomonadota bacterium]
MAKSGFRRFWSVCCAFLLASAGLAVAQETRSSQHHGEPSEFATAIFSNRTFTTADGAVVPVELGLPTQRKRRIQGVVLFAHGANLWPEGYRALTHHWVEEHYIVISPTFVDSERHPARVASDRPRILRERLRDYGELAAQIESELNGAKHLDLLAGLTPEDDFRKDIPSADLPLHAAGHSYGAYLAQMLAGASAIDGETGDTLTLPRPKNLRSVLALSPPPAFAGFSPKGSWATIGVPMLVQSGPGDVSPPFVTDWRQHFDSYCDVIASGSGVPAFTAIYLDTDHYFGGTIGRPVEGPSQNALDHLDMLRFLTEHFFGTAGDPAGYWEAFDGALKNGTDRTWIDEPFDCSYSE